MNILVVDDSPTMRQIVKAALGDLPDGVFEEAGDGQEAIERLAEKPIDLVVLDLNMPGMDGLDVVRYVRGHQDICDIPIIVLSGGGDENSLEAPLAVGASCCLAKPFDSAELKNRARELLEANHSGNQDAPDQPEQAMAFGKFMDDYFVECETHMGILHRDILELEKYVGHESVAPNLLNEIFRSFHSLNGLSSMVGVAEAELLADKMEEYLRALRQGQEHLSDAGIHALTQGIEMLDQVIAARLAELPPPEIADVLDELNNLVLHLKAGAAPVPAVASDVVAASPGVDGQQGQQTEEESRLAAAFAMDLNVWKVVFTSSAVLAERGITVSVIRDRLKASGELIQVTPCVMDDGKIAFEFIWAGNEDAETALASWVSDGVTYAPHVPAAPSAPAEMTPAAPVPSALDPEGSLSATNSNTSETLDAASEAEQQKVKPMTTNSFLSFCVEETQYALDVAAVERAVPAAEVTPLPDAPEAVLGLVNIAGEIMPVIDMRSCLGLPSRDMELSDRFIVAHAAGRPLALLVDKVEGVVELSGHVLDSTEAARSGSTVAVAKLPGSIVMVQDIDALAAIADLPNNANTKILEGTHA